jgi:peptidoglycan/xylan/chitin deacetylase (PgdA/CDA1 family)
LRSTIQSRPPIDWSAPARLWDRFRDTFRVRLLKLLHRGIRQRERRLKNLYLLYHELGDEQCDYSYAVASSAFADQLDLFARLQKGTGLRPELTFDDGHRSNYEVALPLLCARDMKAHFFITAGWTGVRSRYMGWSELRALRDAGQRIGAHGWSHALLTHCNAAQLHEELCSARSLLQDKLGADVTTISLPGGRFNRRVLAACRDAGYTQVYTSVPRAEVFPLGATVGRLNVRRDMELAWIAKLLAPGSGVLQWLRFESKLKDVAKMVLRDDLYASLWARVNRKGRETDDVEDIPA